MKKAKRKKDAPRSATPVDTYIGAQMRKRRLTLKMGQAHREGLGRLEAENSEVRSRPEPRQRGAAVRHLQGFESIAVIDV
jgi:hypothetical protein